jgi:hypothetical protein
MIQEYQPEFERWWATQDTEGLSLACKWAAFNAWVAATDALMAENDKLRHDIERHVAIAAAYVNVPTDAQIDEANLAVKLRIMADIIKHAPPLPDDDTAGDPEPLA